MPVLTYRTFLPLAWLLLGVSLVGCRVNRTRQTPIFTAEGYCNVSPPAASLMDSLWMLQIDRDSVFSSAVQRRFSQRARSVAADIGIQAILTDWVRAEAQFKAQPTDADRSRLVMLRHDISDRILLATQELTTVLAELACERTRATELKNYLEQQTDKRVFRLTILSVLAGALSTVVSGTLAIAGADDPYVEGVAMGGAVMSGYWALRASGGFEEADFSHRRNLPHRRAGRARCIQKHSRPSCGTSSRGNWSPTSNNKRCGKRSWNGGPNWTCSTRRAATSTAARKYCSSGRAAATTSPTSAAASA
jgi:hypothetical protein